MTKRRRRRLIHLSSATGDAGRIGSGRNGPRTALLVLLTVAACVLLAIALFGR